ncbi:diguanylate cyclase/phosphodiesterase [Ferrimonas sediminum]|uniref:Diguanylate cyclase/phosphodiesterase n=1 Tax=Ferrimonas sediminum TaxID=718193 RepID=A0A1G8K729_9GAMM|nr:EAL domain-containing protein [Ferrimonas sediminum]SDI39306.1 diguanylate cyclase/phosphodiesterase [Ferrimonas sediminum]
MKKTQEQTQRLIAFWVASLSIVVFALLVSAWTAAYSHSSRNQQQNVQHLAATLERQFFRNADLSALDRWLPDMLLSYEFSRFGLVRDGQDLYRWQAPFPLHRRQNHFDIRLSNEVHMQVVMPAPQILTGFSGREWAVIFAGLLASVAMVVVGYFWLSREMNGVEMLARRSRKILAGDLSAAAHAASGERPISAARAISRLHRSWNHERQAKKNLDHYIRANTFLDANLGIGNRSFFEHRLQAFAEQGEIKQQGMVSLIQFTALEGIPAAERKAFMIQFIDLTRPLIAGYFDAVFASRSSLELGLLIPQLPLKECEGLLAKLVKVGNMLSLPKAVDAEELMHIGVAYYNRGDTPDQVMSEAEMALRAAQLQGDSGWFMYDKGAVDRELAQGSVRWRSMIENALSRDGLVIYMAPVKDHQGGLNHLEVFSRMRNNQGELMRASLYRPMAWRCGLIPQIELRLVEIALRQLRDHDWPAAISVNVSAESLLHERFIKRLKMILASYSTRRQQLIVEINERELVSQADKLEKPLRQLQAADCLLAVDGVGQSVEELDYIDRFAVNYLKLHTSLSQKIHLRPENQLYIGSLVKSLAHSKVKVMAEGVELEAERQRLSMLDVVAYQGALAGKATPKLQQIKSQFKAF